MRFRMAGPMGEMQIILIWIALALPAIGLAWRRATCQSVPARRVLLRTVRCPTGLTGFILDCESAFGYGEPPAGACE